MAIGNAGQKPFGGHAGHVLSVAFRPGGFYLATGGEDGTIRLWDLGTGEQRAQFVGHAGPINSLAYSPDGAVVASASQDWTVRIWDASTGEQRGQLTGHSGSVRSVVYTADGLTIGTAGDDRTVRIWDAVTGQQREQPKKHVGAVKAIAFSPDGKFVASAASDRKVWIWGVSDDKNPRLLTTHIRTIEAVAFSLDGECLASAGGDRSIRISAVRTGEQVSALTGHSRTVNALAFSPAGKELASAGADRMTLIWNLETGELAALLNGHSGPVNGVAYNEPGRLDAIATVSDDGTARIWDGRTQRRQLTGHTGPVNSVAYSPGGDAIATAGADQAVRIWDAKTGDQHGLLPGHDGSVTAMAYSPVGARIVTADDTAAVRIWDLSSGDRGNATAQKLRTAHSRWVRAVAYKPDGTAFATASDDGTVQIWDSSNGKDGTQLVGHSGPVSSVAYRADGALVTGGSDGTVRVWDTNSGHDIVKFYADFGEVLVVACSPQKNNLAVVAAGGDGTVLIWDGTARQLGRISAHIGPVYALTYDPDGSAIATAGEDGTIRIWDSATFAPRGQLTGHIGAVRSVAYSPDGAWITSCSYDGTIRVWEARTHDQVSGSGFGLSKSSQLPLAGVSSDNPSKVDLIGVEPDVATLSQLIAAIETIPPLAIALIGEWGAGKSNVMELVHANVRRLAELSANNRDATAFLSSICQIPFNAWHYSSEHLWASLAREMFQVLAQSGWPEIRIDQDEKKVRTQRAKLRARLSRYEKDAGRLTSELDKAESANPPGGLLQSLGSPSYVAKTFAYSYREGLNDARRASSSILIWTAIAAAAVTACFFLGPWIKLGVALIAGLAGSLLPLRTQLGSWHRMLVDKTNTLHQNLDRKLTNLNERATRTRQQLSLIDAQFRLHEFLQARGNATVYRQGRGLVGDVHDDLRELSQNLIQARLQWCPSDGQAEPPGRIVLYIDDLDRCPPDRVVEMLEAVHLILTLDLFVVVVAVDARWMIRSLESHYREFFDEGTGLGDNQIAPYDYLDKIFQIPYTLVPPGNSQVANYLRSLLPKPRLATGQRSLVPAAGPQAEANSEPDRNGYWSADREESAAEPNDSVRHASGERGDSPLAVPDLLPESLRLSHAEVEFMTKLGALTPSPRATKRMANLYRLVRISIPDAKLAVFLGDTGAGPYRAVQVLIAVLTGSPDSAGGFFECILRAPPTHTLFAALESGSAQVRGADDSIAIITAKLKALNERAELPSQVREYQEWCPQLARYSFRTWRLARDLAYLEGRSR
ncbi:MAG TPA: P-loop NTPase fold protein [Streptosporangiaceae bacterium]|nr:P-loop NTPase fold protein [Streptosporangiaceae bacterium]